MTKGSSGVKRVYDCIKKLMISDFLVSLRGLRRSPAFTVAAIVTLALGIGANTTMFSVVNSVLVRPLPGYQTDRLVQICDDSLHSGCNYHLDSHVPDDRRIRGLNRF